MGKINFRSVGNYTCQTHPGLTLTPETAINYNTAAAFDYAKLAAAAEVVVTDQYGVKTQLTAANTTFADTTPIVITLTFSKVSGNLKFSGNGSGAASVDEMARDSVFNVVVSAGTLTSAPLKVTATSAFPVADPDVTGFTFTATAGLQEGNNNAKVGEVAGTFSAPVGGTAPFTYSLVAGTGGNDADNDKFEVAGTGLKIKDNPLTAGNYKVYVQIKDSKGKTFEKALTITVIAS